MAPGVLAFIVADDARWCMASFLNSVSDVVSSDQLVVRVAAEAGVIVDRHDVAGDWQLSRRRCRTECSLPTNANLGSY
jgi:hypothetical protein